MLPVAFQIGLPGTLELMIVLLSLFFFVIPAGIIGLIVVYLLRRESGNDERVEELEREVEQLREERAESNAESPPEG